MVGIYCIFSLQIGWLARPKLASQPVNRVPRPRVVTKKFVCLSLSVCVRVCVYVCYLYTAAVKLQKKEAQNYVTLMYFISFYLFHSISTHLCYRYTSR